jgi:release factor glutamine methyltransferase
VTVVVTTVRERLDQAIARLAAAGVETPRVDAEWLLAGALGVPRGRLLAAAAEAVPAATAERFGSWIERRARREPLQHILGTQAFRDVTLRVGPEVLVPRPETELLVSWALELLPAPRARRLLVLDVGTGSGCIACALAHERPDVEVIALDASPAAAALARANVEGLGVADRVRVCVSDLFSSLASMRADLVVSNPPYMRSDEATTLSPEVRDHEPRRAIDGGPDGLDVIRRLVSQTPPWLRPGAPLLLETAGGEQLDAVTAQMRRAGFTDIANRRDLNGVTRFVSGRCSSAGSAGTIAPGGRQAEGRGDSLARGRRQGSKAPLRVD